MPFRAGVRDGSIILAAILPKQVLSLPIIHLDDDVVAVDKPVGLPTHAAYDDPVPGDVMSVLRRQLGIEYLSVHQRLDSATSGVLLFGRRPDVNRWLAPAFEQRRVHKTYVAVIHGAPTRVEDTIDAPIAPAPGGRRIAASPRDPLALPARTRFRVIEVSHDGACSLVELHPETGRTHQLRVHLLSAGHPIVGDALYDPARPAPRMMLHARRLGLPGDDHHNALELTAPVPRLFHDAIALGSALFSDPVAFSSREGAAVMRALINAALERRAPLLAGEDALRLVNDRADGLDGLRIDLVGSEIAVRSDERWGGEWTGELVSTVRTYLESRREGPFGDHAREARNENIVALGGALFTVRQRNGQPVWPRVVLRDHCERVRWFCVGRRVAAFDAGELAVAAAASAADLLIVESDRKQLESITPSIALNPELRYSPGLLVGRADEQMQRLARRGREFDTIVVGARMPRGKSGPALLEVRARDVAELLVEDGTAVFLGDERDSRRATRAAVANGLRSGTRSWALSVYPTSAIDAAGGPVLIVARAAGGAAH